MELIIFAVSAFISVACVIGYVKNIIKLMKCDAFNGELIVRAVGIFVAPLGIIMGFVK